MTPDPSKRDRRADDPQGESHLVQIIVLTLLGAIMAVLIGWPLSSLLIRIWGWLT